LPLSRGEAAARIIGWITRRGGGKVAIALLVDNPEGSQEIYDRVRAQLDLEAKPAGSILHFAGPSPNGGWRVIEAWESEEDAWRFLKERLEPAFEAVGAPGMPQPQFWVVYSYIT
jgi:hypothetical protein